MAAYFQFDLVVVGGGPAGYAAAIRAGQLGKRVLCVEKENLGGTCLNWGCIPTKALLDNADLVRKLQNDAATFGLSFDNLKIDFTQMVKRSRDIAGKLSKGIAHLLSKHKVKHEAGIGHIPKANTVRITKADGTNTEVTAEHILIATGARSRTLPGIEFDGTKIISSREAMTLKAIPKSLAIIGAGAIGCEFADVYSALGTKVTIIELLDHILPIEDEDCSILLERVFKKHGIDVLTKHKTDKVEKTAAGVTLSVSAADGSLTKTVEAELVLMAVGVTGNVEGLFGKDVPVVIERGHIQTTQYKTAVPGIWAAGDVIGPPWLAHVAHHEAINCVEKMFGFADHKIDYSRIPGCTYTHPQVASIGLTEKKAREKYKTELKIGKFPFSASGRAMASGETDGFVKLIFTTQGELVGAHMIGAHVTEMLAELGLAQKLEATENEIIDLMHPHPTLSEAIMEAAGVADGRAIHL